MEKLRAMDRRVASLHRCQYVIFSEVVISARQIDEMAMRVKSPSLTRSRRTIGIFPSDLHARCTALVLPRSERRA